MRVVSNFIRRSLCPGWVVRRTASKRCNLDGIDPIVIEKGGGGD